MSVVIEKSRLAYLRYTTKQFIQDESTSIAIKRQVKTNKPGGGHDFPKIDLPPQKFRFINQDITSGIAFGIDDGLARRFSYVIVGPYNADLNVNDTWTDNNIQYKVDAIIPGNGWETRAYVTAFAMEPEHG